MNEVQTVGAISGAVDGIIRRQRPENEDPPPSVITVRCQRELHEALKNAAHDKRISLNQLCVFTLTALVNELQGGQDDAVDNATA